MWNSCACVRAACRSVAQPASGLNGANFAWPWCVTQCVVLWHTFNHNIDKYIQLSTNLSSSVNTLTATWIIAIKISPMSTMTLSQWNYWMATIRIICNGYGRIGSGTPRRAFGWQLSGKNTSKSKPNVWYVILYALPGWHACLAHSRIHCTRITQCEWRRPPQIRFEQCAAPYYTIMPCRLPREMAGLRACAPHMNTKTRRVPAAVAME